MRRKETYPTRTTTRKKIYYPEGQIQKGLYTEGREWMLEDGTEYIGDYHKYITGEVFTKSSFIKNVSQLLIPFIDMSVKDLKQKFDYDTLIEEPTRKFVPAVYGITLPTQKDYDKLRTDESILKLLSAIAYIHSSVQNRALRTEMHIKNLLIFIEGFFSIEIKSARFSIDELMSSKEKTNAKERRMTIHSEEEIFKK